MDDSGLADWRAYQEWVDSGPVLEALPDPSRNTRYHQEWCAPASWYRSDDEG